ncbi:acetate kinase [Planomicrobium sp. HSC-17F08]|nr:acetate kinase [Planomicrobium sp. HSC-17F08]
MNKAWYEEIELVKLLPEFQPPNILRIKSFQYYETDTPAYEKVSVLDMSFCSEAEEGQFEMTLTFNNVSSLNLHGFGNAFNQISGFGIRNLKGAGFEKERRYLIEDYEDDLLNFYCESIVITSANMNVDKS